MKIISKQKEFTHELPGVVSEDGKNATIHGSLGVYMIMWVTEEEAELICKLIRIKMDRQTGQLLNLFDFVSQSEMCTVAS